MSQRPAQREMRVAGIRVTVRLIVSIVLLILLAIFIAQNAQHVRVTLYFWEFSIRLVWVLIGSALVGALIGWLLPRLRGSRR